MKDRKRQILMDIYNRLLSHYGPQHWWPGDESFEIIVGAILTQSAAWSNVERGIANLKKTGVLSPRGLRNLPLPELADLIYPCGYYNAKAVKLKAFVEWFIERFEGSLEKMFALDAGSLREELLEVHGIGEETADSILLYAGNKPIFVIDAYTKRTVDRLGLKPDRGKYADYQNLFQNHLPHDARTFNEYHALFVAHGKNACRKNAPRCEECCLSKLCSLNHWSNKIL